MWKGCFCLMYISNLGRIQYQLVVEALTMLISIPIEPITIFLSFLFVFRWVCQYLALYPSNIISMAVRGESKTHDSAKMDVYALSQSVGPC
jgi:hypothetical protein